MLCRARNEKDTRPYQGVMNDDNPTGCPALAGLLHLLDLIRAHPNHVAYTEQQLINAYKKRGVELCRWTLSL